MERMSYEPKSYLNLSSYFVSAPYRSERWGVGAADPGPRLGEQQWEMRNEECPTYLMLMVSICAPETT